MEQGFTSPDGYKLSGEGVFSYKIPRLRRVRAWRLKDGKKTWLSGMGYINAGILNSVSWYTETDNEANAAIFMGTFTGSFTADGKVFELEDVAE